MIDPLDQIEQACYLAFRLLLRPSTTPTDCLSVQDGFYCFRDQARDYHPLQAVLVSEDATTGDWKSDAAAKLGVSAEWLDGFMDGFAEIGETRTDQDYRQGYLTAEELRQRRPGLFRLPPLV
jgi:hypothetical protein